MSKPHFPEPVFFFCGLLYRHDLLSEERLKLVISDLLGSSQLTTLESPQPSLRNYYEKEMGPKENLKRKWVLIHSLYERQDLLSIKVKANDVEESLTRELGLCGRPLNIDPGYLSLEQVVLATNKPYSHRIYLGQGIYADLVYQFQNKEWSVFPWTYPDYLEDEVRLYFKNARTQLLGHMREA